MNRLQFILPILVLLLAVTVSYGIMKSPEKPHRKQSLAAVTSVEVIPLLKSDFQVWVNSQGTVTPRTESTLIPEVSGRITSISPAFREGAFFAAGQPLLQIDSSNYRIAEIVAQSKVATMALLLAEEQAKARQAKKNWKRLGKQGKASDLLLHKPQLIEAKASLAAATAQLQQSRLNRQKTRITAPYAGRVLQQLVDVGQYVSPGTALAKIYAVDYAEIRLPLSDKQLQFINVPELYRGQNPQNLNQPEVELSTVTGDVRHHWQGYIVRAEGAYDTRSRRLSLVAQVDDPYGKKVGSQSPPLKVGQFVEARIKGKLLHQVFIIPRAAIRNNSQLMIVDAQSRLKLRSVTIIWQDAEYAVIRENVQLGEWLCITPVPYAINGLKVQALVKGKPALAERRALSS